MNIKTFTIERFRGIQSCTIDGMRRITLLTGRNNVGKTALIEAMFIFAGRHNPSLAMVIQAMRGINKTHIDGLLDSDAPWRGIFYDYDDSTPIRFIAKTGDRGTTNVSMSLATETNLGQTNLGPELHRLIHNSDASFGATRVLRLTHSQGGRSQDFFFVMDTKRSFVSPTPSAPADQARYISAKSTEGADVIASQFTRLQVEGRVPILVEALQVIEPRLKDLALGFTGDPVIHGDIGLPNRKLIPLAQMGDGLNRITHIFLGLSSTRVGTLFVDDIDTGLHYSAMPGVWDALYRAAKLFDVQVVATTHSNDCAHASLEAAEKSKWGADLSLIRLERSGNKVVGHTFSAEELRSSFDENLEVR